jgi:transcriptional regulator with GAF, ATPase, and Fis domain
LDHLDDLTQTGPASEADLSLQAMVRRFEAELIRQALMRTGGKQRQAARLLGEKKTTLNAKILRYGIRVEEPGSQSAGRSSVSNLNRRQAGPTNADDSE